MNMSFQDPERARMNGATSLTLKSLLEMPTAAEPRPAPRTEEPSEDAFTLRVPRIAGPLIVLAGIAITAAAVLHMSPVHYRVGLTNTTASPLRGVVVRMGADKVSLGDLAPGESFGHTFVRSSRPGAIDVSAIVDGKRAALGQCPVVDSERSQTRIVVRGPVLDDTRDCVSDAPRRVGWLP